MITASNIHRSYTLAKKKVEVLQGIDLEIPTGEKVFLCGPSGAGKTTLMYTLAGLEKPQVGKVMVNDVDFYKMSATKQARMRNDMVGYVFQNYFLLPELTAVENVLVPSMIGGKPGKDKALAALERVGLGNRVDHLPTELSGGEQQRVAIARALVNEPDIIFADEPTGNLDTHNGDEIMNILLEVVAERQATLVVVTHDRALSKAGDRVLTIVDGKVVQE